MLICCENSLRRLRALCPTLKFCCTRFYCNLFIFVDFSETCLGCSPCDCDAFGSKSANCDVLTGQCSCVTNVVGRKCDQCAAGTFGLLSVSNTSREKLEDSMTSQLFDGCEKCECDPKGLNFSERLRENESLDVSCDEMGNCGPCRTNVTGKKCDRCIENHFKKTYKDFETEFYECERKLSSH